MNNSTKGKAGSFRVEALDSATLAKMERHGLREDETSLRRKVNDDEPLVYGGRNIVELQKKHVEGRKQQGKTKAMHALVQFPSDLIPNTEKGQKAMLRHAVEFVNKQYGGDAVFAARLDRDEKGTHKVDVFFLPRWQFKSKSGKTQDRCGIGTFAVKEAKRRYVKQPSTCPKTGKPINIICKREPDDVRAPADDKRSQGAAMQDCLFEYLHKGLPEAVRGQRKVSVGPDRVEPEVHGLRKDKEALELARILAAQDAADERQQVVLAMRALKRQEEEVARAAEQNRRDAEIIAAVRRSNNQLPEPAIEVIKEKNRDRSR